MLAVAVVIRAGAFRPAAKQRRWLLRLLHMPDSVMRLHAVCSGLLQGFGWPASSQAAVNDNGDNMGVCGRGGGLLRLSDTHKRRFPTVGKGFRLELV